MLKSYTTGQVAKICRVAPRSVHKWIAGGMLPARRIPCSTHRRIDHEPLLRFMRDNGMPTDWLPNTVSVLLIAQDQLLVSRLSSSLGERMRTAMGAFDAGVMIENNKPSVLVVDFAIGLAEAICICQRVREVDGMKTATIIGLIPNDGAAASFNRSILDETVRKPVDVELLSLMIQSRFDER